MWLDEVAETQQASGSLAHTWTALVLLLAVWTARRFGRIAGAATGLFAAGAPLHVHYSQELRPYSLALLCVTLAVIAADRLLARVDGRRLGLAALASADPPLRARAATRAALFPGGPALRSPATAPRHPLAGILPEE